MKTRTAITLTAAALMTMGLLSAVTVQAALLGRLPATPGGTDYQAYYDTVLDITWLADANLAATNTFGVTDIGIGPWSGQMDWYTANEWIAAMNAASYLGINDWRLPEVGPVNGSTFDITVSNDGSGSTDYGYNISAPGSAYPGSTGSEMAHLFYNTLGNASIVDTSGNPTPCEVVAPFCLTNTGPFSNILPNYYASGTTWPAPEGVDTVGGAWFFSFQNGHQALFSQEAESLAWAVYSGDIAPVPVPAAIWLFGSALGVLGWLRCRRTPVIDG